MMGFGHETEIVVRNNTVIGRNYKAWSNSPQLSAPGVAKRKSPAKGWKEGKKDIGSHKQGAKAATLDELYAEAKKIIGKTLESHHKLYVRFDTNLNSREL